MTVAGVEAVGLPQLVARLDHARTGLDDLTDANRRMVELVARDADPAAPRRTGKLASSTVVEVSATGWGLVNGQPYATPVHWGTHTMRARPWLLNAADRTEDQWMQLLADHVQQLLDN